MDYKILYGVSLYGYCSYHNITLNELKERIKKDIELLEINYRRYASRNEQLDDEELFIAMSIKSLLDKKREHLKDIEKEEKKEKINPSVERLQSLLNILVKGEYNGNN